MSLKKQRKLSHQHNLTDTIKSISPLTSRKRLPSHQILTDTTNPLPDTSRKNLLNKSLYSVYKYKFKEHKKLQVANKDSGFVQEPPLPPTSKRTICNMRLPIEQDQYLLLTTR